jgi:hypothetical protein
LADERDEINRGNNAARLLGDPLITEAFESIRAEYLAAWESSPARDTEGRERIWAHLQALTKVRGHLEAVVMTGKMAEKQASELRGKRRFF